MEDLLDKYIKTCIHTKDFIVIHHLKIKGISGKNWASIQFEVSNMLETCIAKEINRS